MELPKRIYLQAFGDDPPSDEFVCDEDVTWSAHRINASDHCYILAGKRDALTKRVAELEKALRGDRTFLDGLLDDDDAVDVAGFAIGKRIKAIDAALKGEAS
jgi:hypothetical protein